MNHSTPAGTPHKAARRLAGGPNVVTTLVTMMLLVACCCQGSPLHGKLLDEHGRLKSLRFMHIPKTGTSLILLLRNYLTSCTVKDVTCSGNAGGDDASVRLKGGGREEETCGGNLVHLLVLCGAALLPGLGRLTNNTMAGDSVSGSEGGGGGKLSCV